ncbi:gliding motility-associated C-terminal domain-containing protein, partial [Aureispira]|nr:gliding motility-associated C-terminal domain-containing protein [Aureispira sp.]
PGISQQIQLTANSFSSIGSLSSGTFGWIQNSGTPIVFSDDTISSPLVTVPSNTVDGDSIVLTVTFTTVPDPVTGTQCVTTDDVVIYLSALPLNLNILASDTSLCPNLLPDTVSFSTSISGPGIDLVNGIYSWSANPGSYLSDLTSTTINNPDAIIAGSHNDSVVYTINYTYGLCVGSDDIKLKWRTGEINVSATMDTICPGDTTTLMSNLTDTISFSDPSACSTYTVAPITFAPVSGSGSNVNLSDDALTSSLSIGFNFDFYCNTYSQFRISSNGYITFDLTTFNNGCCTGQNLPNNFDPNNLIALAWEDINPASGGTINYFTTGTAPNRKLVVNFINVPRFGGANNITGQIVLHESTNYIDVHTTTVLPDGNTTQGIENVDGTLAIAVPGRNSSQWSASNDAYRFSPGIAFLFGPITYSWTPGFSVTSPNTSTTGASPQGSTTYYIEINEQGCIQQDSIEIYVNSQIPPPTVSCGTPFNQATSVLFEWGMSPGATAWEYSLDSGITYVPVPLSDSFLLITGLTNGDCANILVRALGGAGPCPTNAATYLECCTTPCPMPNTSITTDLLCNGVTDGTIQIAITGGVLGDHPNFTATLFDTTGGSVQVGSPLSSPDTVLFTGLAAGTYYAYLQDTFGCFTYSDTVTITEPDSLIASLDSMTLTTCYDDSDGTASVLSTGGTPSYTWLWDSTANNQTSVTATGLAVGVYQVVLSDSRGCTDTLSVNVNSPFPGPPTLTLTTTASNTCTGNGTATVFTTINMLGNANNFNYIWSNSNTNAAATGLVPGVATVTVTDENGCVATTSTTITGSASLSVTTTFLSPGCGSSDGEITAIASGDSIGYLYQWSANAFSQTTVLATGLPVGTYSVIVTGISNGCTDTASVTLTNNSVLNIVGFSPVNPSCGNSDGSILALTLGAVGSLSYNWSDGQTTNPATGLAAGTYLVTITDQSTNCSDIADTILVEPIPTASFTAVNNPACNLSNGSITAAGANAPGPFTYLWSDGQTDATAQGLSPSVPYSCTVSYQGCSVVVADTTLSNDILQIAITDKDDIICNGDLASYANVTLLSGDSATTSFIWSNNATTQNISGLAAGTYTVTATSGSCTVTQSITVIDITLTTDPWVVTSGQDVGTIQLNGVVDIDGGLNTNHANPAYYWTQDTTGSVEIGDSSLISTTATGLLDGTEWLYFNVTAGPCSAMDSIYIIVESYMGMPTAFTPNGDGINDYFQPAGLAGSIKVFQFNIFNRWGQLLYDDALNHSWDGTFQGVPQPMEVYVYVFEYAPDNGDPILIRGEFTLIR